MRTGRVRTRGEFAALRERGLRSRSGSIRVVHVPEATEPAGPVGGRPRLAFAVGRPVGTAVVRNRLRRQLRAAFTELAPPAGLYLISVLPAARQRSYSDLRAELAAALDDLERGR
jgi:ribonuclease P protein component